MSSKKIYLIRHGETEFNRQSIVQGSGINSSLNATGQQQAQAFYTYYGSLQFDKIYTSALRRTAESVDAFIRRGIPTEALPGLNEISWGIKEGTRIDLKSDASYYSMLAQWQLGQTGMKIEGGESPEEVLLRMQPAVDHIMARKNEEQILICMHGRAIRILLCMLLNYPLSSMDRFEHQNLCLYTLDYSDAVFTLELQNDTRHLLVK